MFASFANSFRFSPFSFGGSARAIDIPAVPVHDVETSSDKRARAVKHYLKINHVLYSIIFNELRFHNHTPHFLGSAYVLGATEDQLGKVYETESAYHEPWQDSPGEITKDDWRDYLGKRNYQRAYVDFYEDQLVSFGYDWKALLEHYLYNGDTPLFSALIGGLGHSLIHLGYAYELSSQTVAIEALVLTSCFYSDLHKYTDDPSYTRPSSYKSSSVLEILQKVSNDKEFDDVFAQPTEDRMGDLLEAREDAVLKHWNAWEVTDPKAQFEESQKAAVALVVATHDKDAYNFFLVHVLTTSHAVRILLPIIPPEYQMKLVRQWFFFALLAYITQERPAIKLERIESYKLDGRGWKYVVHEALTNKYAGDAHFVKGLRAMKNAAELWGDDSEYFIKAAVKLAAEFDDWGGV